MASAIFEASAEEQALIIGPQGRNIIALAKQFNVRIQMPQPPSSTVKIDGEQTEAAITAIRQLLSRRNHLPSKTAKTKDNGLGTADSVPQLTDTLHTLRTSSHYYLKYQLYVQEGLKSAQEIIANLFLLTDVQRQKNSTRKRLKAGLPRT